MGTEPKRAVILVTDAGKGCAIACIRSLGRQGYRVIAADSDPSSLGFRSRFVHRTEVYPESGADADAFCEAIDGIVRKHGVDLVIPATDWSVQPLARVRESFAGRTHLAIAENDALAVTARKSATVELAQRIGVPVPETRVVRGVDEALAAAPGLGWPLVLKPRSSHHMRDAHTIRKLQVGYAESEADLIPKMARLGTECPVLLQRYFAGAGHGVSMLCSDGRPLAAFEHRRLREVPVTGGASSYRVSAPLDPTRYDYARRMLAELRWTGLAMVEFKVGESESQLMEINGRVWGSLPLGVASGVDFPAMLARLYLEGEEAVQPLTNGEYRIGVRGRNLESDLLWIAQTLAQQTHHPFLRVPGRAEAIPAIAGLFNPRNKMDLQCLDDPLPGVLQLPRIARKLWGKFRDKSRRQSGSVAASHRAR